MKIETILTSRCTNGDVLAEDIYTYNGTLLVSRGTQMSDFLKTKLLDNNIYVVKVSKDTVNSIAASKNQEKETFQSTSVDFQENYDKSMEEVEGLFIDITSGKELSEKKVKTIFEPLYDNLSNKSSVLSCISEMRSADSYLKNHCINVPLYVGMIARWVGLDENEVKEMMMLSILHDIGKLHVPVEILNRKGPITKDEISLIKQKCIEGYETIKHLNDINYNVKIALLVHHGHAVKNDLIKMGSAGERIKLYANIINIADIFDAMTSNRAYKKRITPFDTFREFEKFGIDDERYDYRVMRIFMANISSYYTSFKVILSDGQKGEVVYIPPHNIKSPVVKVNDTYYDFSTTQKVSIVDLSN